MKSGAFQMHLGHRSGLCMFKLLLIVILSQLKNADRDLIGSQSGN